MKTVRALGVLAVVGLASGASAQIVTLPAVLNGGQEVPAVTTPANGIGSVRINTITGEWSVDLSFANLSAGVTVAHIHRAAAGSNGPVIIGLDGMALSGGRPTWSLITPGITSFNTGGFVTAPFAFPLTELPNLLAGNTYFNVHTSTFPGGEIRGQIIPTPGALAMLGAGGLLLARRRR